MREWSKLVEDLQHFSVTTEQNLWAQITAEKRPGNGVEFSFLKYLMLIFCWPTFVRSKWFKNVKPAFSLLSPPFSYRQFVKERRHEKYGHDRTRSILLILQQLLPTICMGNEKGRWKENFNFHIGLLGLKRAQRTTLTSVSESLSFFFFSLTFISNTCSISCCIFFSFNSRSSFSASSCSSGLLLNETLQKIKQGRIHWPVIAL